MKTLKFALLCLVLFTSISNAQNWNVFNPGYRYNYKYNNNQLVSQVLFVDSAEASGPDSIYYMNRIGVECTGSCPTSALVGSSATVLITNMPQFLQRTIRKYANGLVMFRDTAKLVIDPACQLNQTWLFDSLGNKSATCIGISTLSIFGVSDSIKTILVGSADTLKLSKRFGIIQFPELYNKNSYYRLAGIEHASSYEPTAFYGERVPNAWDFYDFNPGDKFCYRNSREYTSIDHGFTCHFGNFEIKAKAIMSNGYVYTVMDSWDTCSSSGHTKNQDSPGYANARSYTNLSTALLENRMYPGQVISTNFNSQPVLSFNIVRFGVSSQGAFYKYAGPACQAVFPSPGANDGYGGYMPWLTKVSEVYAVGFGRVTGRIWGAGVQSGYCQTCAVKNGALYYGTETFVNVGIEEEQIFENNARLYPNPFREALTLEIGNDPVSVKITTILGETICQENLQAGQKLEIPMENQKTGIYFVQLFQDSKLIGTRKVIKN